MSQTVQIHGDRAVFPASACVFCLRPATEEAEIVKVKGHVVRKVHVPFCDECMALRQHKSPRQVLFERVAAANSILLALVVGAWIYVYISSGQRSEWSGPTFQMSAQGDRTWVWGLVLGALGALIVFGALYWIVEPWSRRFRSPETKAVLQAVTIVAFDWETTTLRFADDEYAERFAQVNQRRASGLATSE